MSLLTIIISCRIIFPTERSVGRRKMTGTYRSILDTAKRLISKQGYTATSIRQIALEAGIGKATIYHYFPDKETIIRTLTENITAGMDEILIKVGSEEDPVRRFEVAAHESIMTLHQTFDMFQIMRRELPGSMDKIKKELKVFFSKYLKLLVQAIAEGARRNTFRTIDPLTGARTFLALIQGTFAFAFMSGENPDPPEKKVSLILDIFFNGIKK